MLDLSFSADGKTLVSLSSDGTIRLWDIETGSQIGAPLVTSVIYLGGSFALNPRNDVLIFERNGSIVLWDLKANKPFSRPLPGVSSFTDMAFDATNNRLALRDSEKGVYLYDLTSGQVAWLIPIDQDFIDMVFSPDGNLLAGARGADIQIWSLDPHDWREQACLIAGRNMTFEEWDSFFPDESYKSTCSQFQASQ
jgi:WD40 repeat protein